MIPYSMLRESLGLFLTENFFMPFVFFWDSWRRGFLHVCGVNGYPSSEASVCWSFPWVVTVSGDEYRFLCIVASQDYW